MKASDDIYHAAHCIIIAQFPIENHSEQGRFAELPPKTMGKVQNLGDYYAIRSIYIARSRYWPFQIRLCSVTGRYSLGLVRLAPVTIGQTSIESTSCPL